MILIIDNYDSFTYNLNDYFKQLGQHTIVKLNDLITMEDISRLNPSGIIISPGPCGPEKSGVSLEVVDYCMETSTPLLGVCLGMQTIAFKTGGNIIQTTPVHGKNSIIKNNGHRLYKGLPSQFSVTRYHSLIIDKNSLSSDFFIDSYVDLNDSLIMSISHKKKPIFGLQYHPESICSEHGIAQLNNFLRISKII